MIYHSTTMNPERSALKQMLRAFNGQYFVTLAFHQHYSMRTAEAKVTLWYQQLMHRLFGRNWKERPHLDGVVFLLLPEVGAGCLHFHGLLRLPDSHANYFERLAAKRWKRLVPSRTFNIQSIMSTEAHHERLFNYITKDSLASQFIHSSFLMDAPLTETASTYRGLIVEVSAEPELHSACLDR